MKRLIGAILLASAAATSEAALVIDTISGAPTPPAEIWGWGEGATATFGQTFTVTRPNNILTSFTFMMADEDKSLYSDYGFAGTSKSVFRIGRWQTDRALTPLLYASGPYEVTTGQYTPAEYTINTGNLGLPSGEYVAFISATGVFNGVNDFATIARVGGGDVYTGGSLVYIDNGNNLVTCYTTAWRYTVEGMATDAAFRATFVPEPAAAVGLPALALASFRPIRSPLTARRR